MSETNNLPRLALSSSPLGTLNVHDLSKFNNPIVSCLVFFFFFCSGATCSGKTTLAKHLRNILPESFIIHQDVRVRVQT
jgi:hypothetical protein